MTEIDFWKKINEKLLLNEKLMLCIVFHSKDSTPGKQGFKMFVDEKGNSYGSIGGGIMEFEVINTALGYLISDTEFNIKEYKHYGDTPGSTGMICCGEQVIGFILLNDKNISEVEKIVKAFENNSSGVLKINKTNFVFENKIDLYKQYDFNFKTETYSDLIGAKERIYIFGGGHVGLAISKVMSLIDFYVVVIDNRNDISSVKENSYANKIINEDYVSFTDKIIEDDFTYITIVTPSHRHDKDVLRAVLNKKVKYIGMMGSESKVKITIKELIAEGINPKLFEKIHSPIGLKINSKTPDEIAVSIAAEIIKLKNSD